MKRLLWYKPIVRKGGDWYDSSIDYNPDFDLTISHTVYIQQDYGNRYTTFRIFKHLTF